MRADHDRKSIENVHKRLLSITGKVDALMAVMDDFSIDGPLSIQHQKQMIAGLKYIDKWAADGHEQVHELLVARGEFNLGGAEAAQRVGRRVANKKTKSKKTSNGK